MKSLCARGLRLTTRTTTRPLVVTIGGGITGLAAAHRLFELEPRARVLILESGAQPGGVLRTVRKDGFLH